MQFGAIPEHRALKQNLIQTAAADKVAHAQMFVGPDGGGQLALALAFATYLNCAAPTSEDSCGTCRSCCGMAQQTHPDVRFVFPRKHGSSNKEIEDQKETMALFRNLVARNPFLTLEEWTQAFHSHSKTCWIPRGEVASIVQTIGLKTFLGRYKIVLLWLPECLNAAAANALLKTLEEPPAYTVFLLVSRDRAKILPTVASRTQQRIVPAFSDQAMQEWLQSAHPDLDPAKAKTIALLAAGNASKARALVEAAVVDCFPSFSLWMRSCYSGDFTQIIAQSDAFHATTIDEQKRFFTYGLQLMRIVLLAEYLPNLCQNLSHAEGLFVQKFGQTVARTKLPEIVSLFTQAHACLERNANAKLVYTHTSIQLSKLFHEA